MTICITIHFCALKANKSHFCDFHKSCCSSDSLSSNFDIVVDSRLVSSAKCKHHHTYGVVGYKQYDVLYISLQGAPQKTIPYEKYFWNV